MREQYAGIEKAYNEMAGSSNDLKKMLQLSQQDYQKMMENTTKQPLLNGTGLTAKSPTNDFNDTYKISNS